MFANRKLTIFSRKQLLMLIWPLLVEQLLSVLVGMIDVLMVSKVGEAAMSGVSLVDSVNNLIIQILFALTAGGTVICAQFIGKKDQKLASQSVAQIIDITVLVTGTIMIIFLLGGNYILGILFGKVEADVMANASTYMFLTALSFPFLALYHSGAAAFRACGNTKISMLVSLFMNGINIVGNAICIFGLHMGVSGVAIPTLIARSIAACMILSLYQKDSQSIPLSKKDFLPHLSIVKKILSIGIPNGVESGLFHMGKLALQSLVATLGTASIAGFAVAANLATFLYLPGNALGAATLTVVGQCYGANEKRQAKEYTKIMLFFNYGLLLIICSIMLIGKQYWTSLYHLSAQSDVYAQGLIFSHSIAMIIWPIGFLIPYYFRAIGKATFTLIVAVFCMWVFRIGLAYIFIVLFHKNVLYIWYAMYVDWIARVFIYVYAFKKSS